MAGVGNSQSQSQNQKQEQRMVAIPTNIAIGECLSKSDDELLKQINDELEVNPALEKVSDEESGDDENISGSEGDSDNDSDNANDKSGDDDSYLKGEDMQSDGRTDYSDYDPDDSHDPDPGYGGSGGDLAWASTEETLEEHLLAQIFQFEFTPDQEAIAKYVIGSIDGMGRLHDSVHRIQDNMLREGHDVSIDDVQLVVKKIKMLDPLGVGAADLRECLMIQLEALRRIKGGLYDKAYVVVDKYIDDLGKKKYDKIRRSLSLTTDEMKQIERIITKLDPKPGRRYAETSMSVQAGYVRADLKVWYDEENESIVVESLNHIPQLQVAESYRLASRSKDIAKEGEQKRVIANYVRQADKFIDIIKNRQSILMRITRAIAMRQVEYFRTLDERSVKPLTMREVAEDVGVDVSMVSRATKERFIETENGCVSLRLFFSEGLSVGENGEDASQRRMLNEIKEIIGSEDKTHPYTDQEIADLLTGKGYQISRRTVAKYREDKLRLPVANRRRAMA